MSADRRASEVFRAIYQTSEWGGGSGQGSRPEATEVYRQVLARLLQASDVRSVVDAGCGDWSFSRLVDWAPVSYLGVDVVPELVEANQASYGAPGVRFACLDLLQEDAPPADVLIAKDVLQHWPVDAVRAFLRRVRPRYRYLLVTNDLASVHCPPQRHNTDIPLGGWRTIDLEAPPFGLRAHWRLDYEVEGQWTKRVLLVVRPSYRPWAGLRPRSALRLLRASWPSARRAARPAADG